jgi:hypothetical protein
MYKQVRWSLVLVALVALLLTGCRAVAPAAPAAGGEAAATDAAAPAEQVVLTFSSQSVPDDAHTKAMDRLCRRRWTS